MMSNSYADNTIAENAEPVPRAMKSLRWGPDEGETHLHNCTLTSLRTRLDIRKPLNRVFQADRTPNNTLRRSRYGPVLRYRLRVVYLSRTF